MKIKSKITTICLFSIIAASATAQSLQPVVMSASGGRYVFGQISSMRSDQYMLDTQTGRLWQIVVNTNNAPSLQAVPYRAIDGSISLIPRDPVEEVQSVVQAAKSASQDEDRQKQSEPVGK